MSCIGKMRDETRVRSSGRRSVEGVAIRKPVDCVLMN